MSTYLGPEFGEWGEWSECSASCDGGERTRSRNCENWCTNVDDTNSDHTTTQTEACNPDACGKFIPPYSHGIYAAAYIIFDKNFYFVILGLYSTNI